MLKESWFDARRNAEIVPLIEEAIQHSTAISTLTEEVLKAWEPTALELDADAMLARFKTEYVGMFHTWKSGYKEDIKTLRLHSKAVGGKVDESTVIEFLQRIKELKARKHGLKLIRMPFLPQWETSIAGKLQSGTGCAKACPKLLK